MAQHVARHHLSVVLIVSHHVGARPHNGHAALQHVVKLRQFVQAGFAQEGAQRGDSLIVFLGLRHLAVQFVMNLHGSKFVNANEFAIPTISNLFEQNRATHGEVNGQGNQKHEGADQHQNDSRQDSVYQLFDEPSGT